MGFNKPNKKEKKGITLPQQPAIPEEEPQIPETTPGKEELLDNLLSRLTPTDDSSWGDPEFEETAVDIRSLDLSEYPKMALPTKIELKIAELKKIAGTIQKKEVSLEPVQKADFSKFKVNYAHALNPAQLAAVVTTEKPVLVIAGAGSGKTRVIVHRVSYLMEKGVDPSAILLLTFTRKAATEMLDRAEALIQDKSAANVTGGTFHSFASFVLRKYSKLIGLPPNFTIIDTADSEDIIDLLRTELKLNSKDKRFPRKGRIYDIISYSRNKNTSVKDIIRTQYSGLEDYIDDIELIYKGYTRYKHMSKILDFDDLMDVLNQALKTNARFRELLQNTWQYIMVDEFQDTNVIQNEIVQILAGRHSRLMVVGDDSQSIYAFRGANYENILRFPEVFPDCVLVKIEENYRSNQKVLDFTNTIIDNAVIGYKKELYTNNKNQHVPVIKRTYGQEEEAVFIVDRVMELLEQGIELNQIAILNRADWHNRYIQTELNKRGIPYVVVGGFKFNERMHIKDVIAFLKLTYNPVDAVSWHRVLKYIGGIGQVTASKVILQLQESGHAFSFETFKARKFYNDLLVMGQMLSKASQAELTLPQKIAIIKDYYTPLLKARETDYQSRMQDVDILIDLAKKYKDLDRFLSDFALDPPSKRVADQSTPFIDEGEEKGKLTISTVHSAKGLEWYAVFIPHALEGMFPSNKAKNIEEMEEERRLFYVACSRAKEELYITFPRNIYSYDAFFHLPSRFLVEMDSKHFEFREA